MVKTKHKRRYIWVGTASCALILIVMLAAGLSNGVLWRWFGHRTAGSVEASDDPDFKTVKDPVVVAAGDIACNPASSAFSNGRGVEGACQMKATSDLVMRLNPTVVLPLGDIQYPSMRMDRMKKSYDPTWGRFKAISRPAIGNHESVGTAVTADYFKYFGKSAGDPDKGYYSFDVGTWHLISLNANCGIFSFHKTNTLCREDSEQVRWLKQDLIENPNSCTLAYWHIPYYSSGITVSQHHGNTFRPFWQALYDAHADVVLSGHDHDYERFAKQDAHSRTDPNGLVQFVVGTGGEEHTNKVVEKPNSVIFDNSAFGVLKMTLHQGSYEWEFISTDNTVLDRGSAQCNRD